jgi:serine/threonine-protein kinase
MSNADETLGWSTLPLGTVLLEKYRVDRVLGVGGTAVVYAVTHRNRRRFALKMLRPDLSLRPDVRARFAREGYVANTVEHPSVVDVLDDDVDERGSVFLVMELLDGLSLDQLCTAPFSALPPREALELADRLLDALEHAHRRSVVHRDIKPSNLFVTREGELKVLDFGVARLRDASIEATHAGTTLGTPAFMAPEQAAARGGGVDARSDVWAVGATLFTLLSGRHVHEGENARQVLVRCATEPPRTLVSVMPDAPPELVALLDGALRMDPDERFASASAMRDAVHRTAQALFGERPHGVLRALVVKRLAEHPEPPPHDPPPTELFFTSDSDRERPAPARHRTIRMAAATAGALAVALLGVRYLTWDAPASRGASPPASSSDANATTEPLRAAALGPSSAPVPPPTPPAPAAPERKRSSSSNPPAPRHATRQVASAAPIASVPGVDARVNPLHLEIQ